MSRKSAVMRRVSGGLMLLVGLGAAGHYWPWWRPLQQATVRAQPGLYRVVADVDGDTIVVNMNGTTEKVRLIGVDTPETHDPRKPVQCYGPVAAAFTKRSVEGNVVRLEADSLSTNRDRYGRLLRYVYLQNGTLLNEILVRQGYGFAYTGFPFSKKDLFLADEKLAQAGLVGIWKDCQPSLNQYGGYTSNTI
jgi:endonuclease YncB( thermonuclease family)